MEKMFPCLFISVLGTYIIYYKKRKKTLDEYERGKGDNNSHFLSVN